MSKRNFISNDASLSVLSNRLSESDAEHLDTAIDALPENGFSESSVTERTLSALGLTKQASVLQFLPARRSRFRVALIAACVAALLLASVTAAKVLYDTRFFSLFASEEAEDQLADAFIPLGLSGRAGGVNYTVVDMIGDTHQMFIEVRTDVAVDNADGWLEGSWPSLTLNPTCTLTGLDGLTSCFTAPFARDGKLWYMIAFADDGAAGRDISKLPVHLTIDAFGENDTPKGSLSFSWTNNYTPKDHVVAINREMGSFRLDSVGLTVSQLVVRASGDSVAYNYNLDSVTLKNGTVLYPVSSRLPFGQNLQSSAHEDNAKELTKYFNLFDGFSTSAGGAPVFVSFEDIASVTVDGTVIPLN